MENLFKRITEALLYLLVFLLPLFFLPTTILPIIISKQILLSLFVFLLLILWMVKVMIEGKLIFAYGKLPGVILLFLLVLVVSTALSGSWHQSFWGMAFEIDTLFNFILFTLVFFLFANLIKPEQVKKVLSSFLVGAGVLALFFLISLIILSISKSYFS